MSCGDGNMIKNLQQVLSQRIKPMYTIEELSFLEIVILLLCEMVLLTTGKIRSNCNFTDYSLAAIL